MKTNYLIKVVSLCLTVFISLGTYAQVSVGSNTEPAKAALLQVKDKDAVTPGALTSTTGGFLPPRVALTQKAHLYPFFTPAEAALPAYTDQKLEHKGLIVYNVNPVLAENLIEGLYIWDGAVWKNLAETIVTADNGLSATGSNVQLGGGNGLTKPTNIAMNGENLNFTGSGNITLGTAGQHSRFTIISNDTVAFALKDANVPTTPGDKKVLICNNADGIATWQNNLAITSSVAAVMPTTGKNITTSQINQKVYTDLSITVGTGAWMVSFGTAAGGFSSGNVIAGNGQYWYKIGLSDYADIFNAYDATKPTGNNQTGSKYINTSLTGYFGAGSVSQGQKLGMVQGNIAIDNNTKGPITLYLWAEVQSYGSPGTPWGTTVWENVFGKTWHERWFYATPMNK